MSYACTFDVSFGGGMERSPTCRLWHAEFVSLDLGLPVPAAVAETAPDHAASEKEGSEQEDWLVVDS